MQVPLSTTAISESSGLSPFQVEALSNSLDWAGVDLYTWGKFCRACRVDFLDYSEMKRVEGYIRSRHAGKYAYLRNSALWESYYQPLMLRYLNHLRNSSQGS